MNNNVNFDSKIECSIALDAVKAMPEQGKAAFIAMVEAYKMGLEEGRSILRAERENANIGGEA
jgi:hypothetical protein